MISKKYMGSWFIIDLLSTIPLDSMVMSFRSGSGGKELRSFKLIRTVRLLKLARIFKLKNMDFDHEMMQANIVVVRIGKLLLSLCFIAHLFGCFWSYFSLDSYHRWWHDVTADHETPRSGVVIGRGAFWTRYIASIYW